MLPSSSFELRLAEPFGDLRHGPNQPFLMAGLSRANLPCELIQFMANKGFCVKLLREPLFHFLIAGALLFAGYEWLNRGKPQSEALEPVRIGEGEARWLRETFASQWRRQPTADEFNGLLATLVNEEVLAREARALGLDQDDTIVRRRLAQKLTS
jgi:hypothetical protein